VLQAFEFNGHRRALITQRVARANLTDAMPRTWNPLDGVVVYVDGQGRIGDAVSRTRWADGVRSGHRRLRTEESP
jgi:hypothetical protein